MSRIVIAPASVTSLVTLHSMFADVVSTHFDYFPEGVQKRVIKHHSVSRLLLATLDKRRTILLAKSDRKIVGYAIGAAPSQGPGQLFWLYVDPDYRGHNTGLSLLSRMLKTLEAKGAKVVSIATHMHRAYYERQGFKFVEQRVVDGVQMDILIFRLNRGAK